LQELAEIPAVQAVTKAVVVVQAAIQDAGALVTGQAALVQPDQAVVAEVVAKILLL
jgi:hypothetical protein